MRISAATPEADLAASVWPGLMGVECARTESAEQLRVADAVISRLEKLRGIRPGTVALKPLIESPTGVTRVREIASASNRVATVGTRVALEGDALAYAQAECELAARTLGLNIRHVVEVPD